MTAPQIPAPDPVVLDDLWDLDADPAALGRAADQWRTFARAATAAADTVDTAANPLRGDAWSGDTADTYHDQREKLGKGVDEIVEGAGAFADALAACSSLLTVAQNALADSLARVSGSMPTAVAGGRVTFRPATVEDFAPINTAIAEAQQIRAELDSDLVVQAGRIDTARGTVQSLAGVWDRVADGADDGWTLPPEASGSSWIYNGESVVLNTGPGDDNVSVRVDPRTGEQIVTVNGVSTTFPPGYDVTIRAGAGNDTVDVAPGTNVKLTLLGGEGNDTLRGGDGGDRILGLDGQDKIEGRGGADRITTGPGGGESVDGGVGDDLLYGGLGGDKITGGDGNDRIEGGDGEDTVDGGAGNDTVRGGSGTDNMYGRSGDDVADGGDGRDYVDGGAGNDRLTGGLGDDTVYGLSGTDTIDGGAGQDYLEGGTDNDAIAGGAGNDMISGGRGDDTIRGDGGDDRVYTGHGRDTVAGGAGNDQVFGQNDDTVTGTEKVINVEISDKATFIKVTGSPEFVERIEADLDMLRASPTGQQMLGNLEKAHEDSKHWFYDGNGLTIKETTDENGYAKSSSSFFGGHEQYQIQSNPSFDTLHGGPPVTILYHELAHVYDYTNDTLADGTYNGPDNPDTPNKERVAAGLPIDHDNDPSTPDRIDPRHPYQYTENGLREELGAPHRDRY